MTGDVVMGDVWTEADESESQKTMTETLKRVNMSGIF